MASTPLYGLVLAGGRSERMARDKAALVYHGGTQLEWAMELVAPFVERAFVSVRADQVDEPVRARFPQVVDLRDDLGPIAGIMAAQAAHRHAAWLVLACDLPYLDAATLEHLLAERDEAAVATAYRSSHDGLPEPLCAVWEPASQAAIDDHIASGKSCPRKLLIAAGAPLIDQPDPHALDNVNTPEELRSALEALAPTSKEVRVHYFALLREEAGCRQESLTTTAATPRALYDELRTRHPFSLDPGALGVAVNTAFGEWSQLLVDGDEVAFIPPTAGG